MSPKLQRPAAGFLLAQSWPVRAVRLFVELVTSFGVAGYAILILAQVFCRYVLNSSLTWSEELVNFMLLWTVMMGSAMATDRGAHIALNPLDDYFGRTGKRVLSAIALLGTIIFCLYLAYYGWQLMDRTWRMRSPASDLPMWMVYSSMPVGSLFIVFFALVHLIDGTDQRMDPMEDRS